MQGPTALFADPRCREHLRGIEHPERPERFDAVMEGLRRAGLQDCLVPLEPRSANELELLLCHRGEYLEIARHDVSAGRRQLTTGDTDISPQSWQAALGAAGGVLNAVDAVISGKARNAFCVVRPPGHHATPVRGMGFCLLNNIAIGARYAQHRHGIERVLIVDWDVHHGNGTQDIFYSDSSVLFCSTHEWPLYPGTGRADETGAGAGKGFTMNFPFPAGSGRKEILGALTEYLVPAADAFRPNLIMISAGFDSRMDDLLGHFTLTDGDFAELTRLVMEIANRHAGGRLISVLEGGYNLSGLASAAAAHVKALIEA